MPALALQMLGLREQALSPYRLSLQGDQVLSRDRLCALFGRAVVKRYLMSARTVSRRQERCSCQKPTGTGNGCRAKNPAPYDVDDSSSK